MLAVLEISGAKSNVYPGDKLPAWLMKEKKEFNKLFSNTASKKSNSAL